MPKNILRLVLPSFEIFDFLPFVRYYLVSNFNCFNFDESWVGE